MKRWPFALFLKLLSPGNQLYGLLEDLPVNNLDGFPNYDQNKPSGLTMVTSVLSHGHMDMSRYVMIIYGICKYISISIE
jgi:hypothetical protein